MILLRPAAALRMSFVISVAWAHFLLAFPYQDVHDQTHVVNQSRRPAVSGPHVRGTRSIAPSSKAWFRSLSDSVEIIYERQKNARSQI